MLRLRNRDQAEDAVQETLLAALEGLDGFAGDSSLRTWVNGILRHKIVDRIRASCREELLDPEEVAFPGGDPQEGFARCRFFEGFERSLARLPENVARVFVLREVLGMDTEEICCQLAISSSNCWVMLHRARLRLRECPEMQGLAADAL